jgi:signal transduction histidine kinase
MKRVGLHTKFAVLFVGITVVLLVLNIAWRSYVQQEQAEREMLETTQVLATEMDAIWEFMEINQYQFKQNEDGTYNLYCVVAAKAVSRMFTVKSGDYIIHYTNLTTRKPDDSPDEFEKRALEALHADPGLKAYYSLEKNEGGSQVFRYVEPLYITESCLECHGDPRGELDIMGYPKEGQKIGDIAGAASIIMPADAYVENNRTNIIQESIIFVVFILCGLATIFWSISRLVTVPVRKLEGVAQQIEKHEFEVSLDDIGDRDEMQDLAAHFDAMAKQLQSLYAGLEAEVGMRTEELAQSNEILQEQRRELESMNLKLQEDNRYKSDFLAIMSHEIRTPLTSILAFADIWARSNAPRNKDEEKIMKEMRGNSQILLAMVNNILEMAKVEAGRAELVPEPVDMADLLNAVRGSTGFLAEKKNVTLTTRIDRDVPVVFIDSEKVRRILENLVSNAIKFTDEQGAVDMDVTYDPAGQRLTLTVTDDGCGIKDEDVAFIFDRFVQGKGSSTYRHGGSGLGLAVVKELAELHGGSVEVKTVFGQGSTFTVTIAARATTMEEL